MTETFVWIIIATLGSYAIGVGCGWMMWGQPYRKLRDTMLGVLDDLEFCVRTQNSKDEPMVPYVMTKHGITLDPDWLKIPGIRAKEVRQRIRELQDEMD